MKTKRILIFSVYCLLLISFGFAKSVFRSEQVGGICLSFDDNDLENWVDLLPLFELHDAKVTFFLTGVGTLSKQEREWVKQLIDAGHEIGAHGEHHLSMNSHIGEFGIRDYWRTEIKEHLNHFDELGIKPKAFAYPYGEKNHYIDLLLLTKFQTTRNVSAKKGPLHQLDEIFSSHRPWKKRFSSLGIGNGENISDIDIEALLNRAHKNQEVVFLHAHNIHDTEKYAVSKERIKLLMESSCAKRLKFYTISERR